MEFWEAESVRYPICSCVYLCFLLVGICDAFSFVIVAADVLLWRNKKISSSVLGLATAIWVFFEWLDYHFLTIISFALLLGMVVQFVWYNFSSRLGGYIIYSRRVWNLCNSYVIYFFYLEKVMQLV